MSTAREKQLQLERKRKAAMFINLLRIVKESPFPDEGGSGEVASGILCQWHISYRERFFYLCFLIGSAKGAFSFAWKLKKGGFIKQWKCSNFKKEVFIINFCSFRQLQKQNPPQQ